MCACVGRIVVAAAVSAAKAMWESQAAGSREGDLCKARAMKKKRSRPWMKACPFRVALSG